MKLIMTLKCETPQIKFPYADRHAAANVAGFLGYERIIEHTPAEIVSILWELPDISLGSLGVEVPLWIIGGVRSAEGTHDLTTHMIAELFECGWLMTDGAMNPNDVMFKQRLCDDVTQYFYDCMVTPPAIAFSDSWKQYAGHVYTKALVLYATNVVTAMGNPNPKVYQSESGENLCVWSGRKR